MSIIDILTRVETINRKFEKYDLDKQRDQQISGTDPFLRLYSVVEAEIEAIAQKSHDASNDNNRAAVATINAEIRRSKAALKNEIPKLQKLSVKKVKGLSRDEQDARPDLVLALQEKIESIPDGVTAGRRGAWAGKAGGTRSEIRMDSVNPEDFNASHYEQTEESDNFRQEYEDRRRKQDQNLDVIAEGLATMRNLAGDMNEELDKQNVLLEEIDTKVDKASSDLKSTNARLKQTVTRMRSNRNFCIDIILLIIVLGIAAYLYNVLK
eukprot:TRINITY_DN17734_c0_g1_i1.p1 TRINITY_DN17734_c0_g1~~TRINITY_DN17734_c0_g1_i1.p1  ORF type:complete len:267 (+),score=71.45 TRINITY_DN17734_c0_g1_i1:168-968(+)